MQETRRYLNCDHRPMREMQQATASITASSRSHWCGQYLRVEGFQLVFAASLVDKDCSQFQTQNGNIYSTVPIFFMCSNWCEGYNSF